MNRLVTGLEKENFQVYDNNNLQIIKSFMTEDAPLSIGIIFDLSGSMQSKFLRARKALSEFLRTCNPQDEFFVVGFNDRPAVLVDYTSDVEDVEARMVMLHPQNRTALIDAMYLGVNKLRSAKYSRKALLVISDGGDNRSRYTEGELTRIVRESEVQIYSIGIFDAFAPTEEEVNGPTLLHEVSESTGGRLFRVMDMQDLSDIAQRISEELRNEYVIGYTPTRQAARRAVEEAAGEADGAAGIAPADGAQPRGVLCADAVGGSPRRYLAAWMLLSASAVGVSAQQAAPRGSSGGRSSAATQPRRSSSRR